MHADMIKRWNENVQPDDIVIHLGDVAYISHSLTNSDLAVAKQELKELFDQLNGKKMLIPGNHDRPIIQRDRHFYNDIGFMNVECDLIQLVINSEKIILSHEPVDFIPEGYTNIHGHVHGGITHALYGIDSDRVNACWDSLRPQESFLTMNNMGRGLCIKISDELEHIEYIQKGGEEHA